MDAVKKKAIIDAVKGITGLTTGVWENQKGAIRPKGTFFSCTLLTRGTSWERKGNLISKEGEQQKILTRLTTTLQVKVYDSEDASDILIRANNNTKFHSILNAGDVVCWGLITSGDISRVYTEYENVYFHDFQIAWTETDDIQQDVISDDVIKHVEIDGKFDDIYKTIYD